MLTGLLLRLDPSWFQSSRQLLLAHIAADKHLFIDWNMSVTQISFFLSLLKKIAAIRIMISSQAHVCGRWLVRERIPPTASWRQRLGLCWKNTISHWRRPKGWVSDGKKHGTHWFLLMFKMTNVGTTHLLSKTTLWLLSVSLSRSTVSHETGLSCF